MTLKIKRAGLDMEPKIRMLVCGVVGSGKTRLASTFKNPLYLSMQPELPSVRERNVRFQYVDSSAMMDEVVSALRLPKSQRELAFDGPVDTLVVDTLDQFQKLLKVERLRQKNQETMQMQDWGWIGSEMESYLTAFLSFYPEMNVVVLSHLKDSRDDEIGRIYYHPALEGSIKDNVGNDFDVVGILEARAKSEIVVDKGKPTTVKGIERKLKLYPEVNAPWVKDHFGKLPLEFPINMNDDYDRMYQLIFSGWDQTQKDNAAKKKEMETRVAAQVEQLLEEVAAMPEPEPEVKPEAKIASKAKQVAAKKQKEETISSEQLHELVGLFVGIGDEVECRQEKHHFVTGNGEDFKGFGNPANLNPKDLEKATEWVKASVAEWKAKQPQPEQEEVFKCETCEAEVSDPDMVELSKAKFNGNIRCNRHFNDE